MSKKSYVYLLRCADGSLYTGYTTNIKRRQDQHNKGLASKYTRARLPAHMVYYEVLDNRSQAQAREAQIKKLKKPQKELMVANFKIRFSWL